MPAPSHSDSSGLAARLLATPLRHGRTWIVEQRWLLCVFLGALLVRLHWNLVVHPLGDYVYSDMHGYVSRAERLIRDFSTPHEYSAFFPFGTHWLVAGLKVLGGDNSDRWTSITFALLGASSVAMAYAVARRASHFRVVPPAVALLGIFYYPHFSIGGYILSETPYCFFLMGAVLSVLRLADTGHWRDALALGFFAGLGALFRPQLLLSAAFVGLYWIARRKALPKIKLQHLLLSGVPLLCFLALGSWHMHHNTGRAGLISENGSFNLVFGRCHNSKIESLPEKDLRGRQRHGHVHFRPPPFLQLANAVERAKKDRRPAAVPLDPAFEDVFSYEGYIGDSAQHHAYVRQCMKKTGPLKQLQYSWTNVSLLWLHNVPWPDSGRAAWRAPSAWWTLQVKTWLMFPALAGLLWLFVPGPRGAKLGLIALQIVALLLLAAIFFGGIRHRAPYDLLLLVLAFESYAMLAALAWKLVTRLRNTNRTATAQPDASTDVSSAGESPAQKSSSS